MNGTMKLWLGGVCLPAIVIGVLASNALAAEKVSTGTLLPPLGKYTAPASDGDKPPKPRGISGMACLDKAPDGSRECFAVNDEERFGQVAVLTSNGVKPIQGFVTVIQDGEAGVGIVGKQRGSICGETKKFGELDGEGVSLAGGYVYIASSHSCSGKGDGKYKPSSFLLTRFKPASATSFGASPSPAVERSWRGADMLLASTVKDAYGKPKGQGTNIEGVAVIGDRLYAGLRTPLKDGAAVLVSAPVKDLFADGKESLPAGVVETIPLALGPDAGIRDLAPLDGGNLLVLSGPTMAQANVEYRLWLVKAPISKDKKPDIKPIAVVRTDAKAKDSAEVPKAESVTVLEQSKSKIVVLVNYDNVDEGGATRHELDLPSDLQ
jgi:hypothetical protein